MNGIISSHYGDVSNLFEEQALWFQQVMEVIV